ncbi:MAG: hypothetical protein PHN51_09965 [Candidatus Nanopelagicales bacterium]|nr:hypothetical protein [Candidatus Nanopelagicales bacterium]MDD2819099.1 hypothetical protein [Candidatus Nanopelagicales bacterium]
MSRTSAYRAEPGSVASAQVAVRIGTLAWVIAGVVGAVVLKTQDGNVQQWLLMSAIAITSGVLGLVFLRRKAQGK